MNINYIFAALVPPLKNKPDEEIPCIALPLEGQLFGTVNRVIQRAPKECNSPIIFQSETKTHPVRDLIVDLIKVPEIESALPIFQKLARVTTGVAGLSLSFAAAATDGRKKVLVISRFPATEGIRTNLRSRKLEIELVKDIFMRSSRAYKAAIFSHTSTTSGFWKGAVVDKQVNESQREIAEYWIYNFLESEFLVTDKSGTAMFANALKKAITEEEDLDRKQQLMAVASLATNKSGKRISMNSICDDMSLPSDLKNTIRAKLESPPSFNINFEFNGPEFSRHAVFKSVYLDNGGIISAETAKFDDCFQSEQVAENTFRYQTEGRVVDVKVRKRP